MKPLLKVAALLTLYSLLPGCGTTQALAPVKPPADRMDCAAIGERPALPSEYVIDWSEVTTVPQAHAEHDRYVVSVRNREGVVTGYIVQIEGVNFACSSDAEWMRDFFAKLPDG